MSATKATAPTSQSRYLTDNPQRVDHQSVTIASGEDVECHEAEYDDDTQYDGNSCGDGHVANEHQCQIEEYGDKPKPEVGKEMHHRIKDD